MRSANHRGHDRQRKFEIEKEFVVVAPNATVIQVHENVGTRLQFSKTLNFAINIVRPGASPRNDLNGTTVLFDKGLAFQRPLQGFLRTLLSGLEADGVRHMTRITLNATQLEPIGAGNQVRQVKSRSAWKTPGTMVSSIN